MSADTYGAGFTEVEAAARQQVAAAYRAVADLAARAAEAWATNEPAPELDGSLATALALVEFRKTQLAAARRGYFRNDPRLVG